VKITEFKNQTNDLKIEEGEKKKIIKNWKSAKRTLRSRRPLATYIAKFNHLKTGKFDFGQLILLAIKKKPKSFIT